MFVIFAGLGFMISMVFIHVAINFFTSLVNFDAELLYLRTLLMIIPRGLGSNKVVHLFLSDAWEDSQLGITLNFWL